MSLEISALLTTRNRAHLLPQVLSGLTRQSLDSARFEVLAIDDGSTDETQRVLAEWKDRLPLRIVRQNHAGVSAAKNLGIFMAAAPILLFLDDDDVADPDLLLAHLAAHIAHPDPAVAVLGYTDLAPEVATSPIMRYVTQSGGQLFSYSWMRPGQSLSYKEFWGGRSSCKRSLLVRYGVFHPDFRFGCEDIELGWRLAHHGLRVIYEPRAQSTMIRTLSFDQFCARSYRQGLSQYRYARMHEQDPDVREYCEIDRAFEAWPLRRHDYVRHLQWTRSLDRLASARQEAGLPAHPILQPTLEEAYRDAFFLSRTKGIADMAARHEPNQTRELSGAGFRPISEFGLSA